MSPFQDPSDQVDSDKENNNNRVVVGATCRSSSSSLTNNKKNDILSDNLIHPSNDCSTTMIGLQRVTRSVTSSSSTSTFINKDKKSITTIVVPMKEGFILGRSSHKIPSTITTNENDTLRPSSSSVRPDLGMTTMNAQQVSRHECTVEEITSNSMTLFIPDKLFHNPRVYKPLIQRRKKQHPPFPSTTTMTMTTPTMTSSMDNINTVHEETVTSVPSSSPSPVPNQWFTLYIGDILIFQTGRLYEDHLFQVVSLSTPTTPTPTTTTTTPKRTVDEGMTPNLRKSTRRNTTSTIEKTPSESSRSTSSRRRIGNHNEMDTDRTLSTRMTDDRTPSSTKGVVSTTTTTTTTNSRPKRSATTKNLLTTTTTNNNDTSNHNDNNNNNNNNNNDIDKTKTKRRRGTPTLQEDDNDHPTKSFQILPIGSSPFVCPFLIRKQGMDSSTTTSSSSLELPSLMTQSAPSADELSNHLCQGFLLPWQKPRRAPSINGIGRLEDQEQYPHDDDKKVEEHDSDDDDDDEYRSDFHHYRDMHTTLGNTLQKALCDSTTPSIGTNLLTLALTLHRLPSPQFYQALIEQSGILFPPPPPSPPILSTPLTPSYRQRGGTPTPSSIPRSHTKHHSSSSSSSSSDVIAIFQQRMILEYLQETVTKYPSIIPNRLTTAAGLSFWREIFSQLSNLQPAPVHLQRLSSPQQPSSSLKKKTSLPPSSRRRTTRGTNDSTPIMSAQKMTVKEGMDEPHEDLQDRHEILLYQEFLERHLLALKFLHLVLCGNTSPTFTSSGSGSQSTFCRRNTDGDDDCTNPSSYGTGTPYPKINTSNQKKTKKESSLSQSIDDSLILQDMKEYGASGACRLAASALAHVICVCCRDDSSFKESQEGRTEDVTSSIGGTRRPFHAVVNKIARYLASILRCMISELLWLSSSNDDKKRDEKPMSPTQVATLLWNVVSSRLDHDDDNSHGRVYSAMEKHWLKIYWFEAFQWGRGEYTSLHPSAVATIVELETILATKMKIHEEEYYTKQEEQVVKTVRGRKKG